MRLLWIVRGGVFMLAVLSSALVLADEFVNFLAKQKVGQEITATGGFRRFSHQRHFFRRDPQTGDVENFDYFGITMAPTMIIGNGTLSLRANAIDSMLLVYSDPELVKDLPEEGENLWFTGTLIGFQFGISGITTSPFSGGDPYVLLKRVSPLAPSEAYPNQQQAPTPAK
jgi:hypothetical protein